MAVDRLDDEGDHRPIAADSPVTREAAVTNTPPDSVTDRPDFAARTARVDDYRATVDAVYRATPSTRAALVSARLRRPSSPLPCAVSKPKTPLAISLVSITA